MQVFLLIIQTNSPKIRGRLSEGFLSFKLHITRFLTDLWAQNRVLFCADFRCSTGNISANPLFKRDFYHTLHKVLCFFL